MTPGGCLCFGRPWTDGHTFAGVVYDGSTIGLGRLVSVAGSTTPAHCAGRPTKRPPTASYPVCTRCSKLDGTDMAGFVFLRENIKTPCVVRAHAIHHHRPRSTQCNPIDYDHVVNSPATTCTSNKYARILSLFIGVPTTAKTENCKVN